MKGAEQGGGGGWGGKRIGNKYCAEAVQKVNYKKVYEEKKAEGSKLNSTTK